VEKKSKPKQPKILQERELRVIQTSKERHGADVFRKAGLKGAQKRWGFVSKEEEKKENKS